MKVVPFVKAPWRRLRILHEQRRVLRENSVEEIPISDWPRSLADPRGFYLDCFRYFHRHLPAELRAHRAYFTRCKRGFGEDAFHTMWFLLFRQFRPAQFLEIGVYRGQTLSLAALLARQQALPCEIHGISPFSSAGDSVSKYVSSVDYETDTLRNFEAFRLPPPKLLKAFSPDPEATQLISSRDWDMAYIDGNHDYKVARSDWEICSENVRAGGLVVLDDSGFTSSYEPPLFGSRGHPGPSQVAQQVPRDRFREILQVGHNRVFQKLVLPCA